MQVDAIVPASCDSYPSFITMPLIQGFFGRHDHWYLMLQRITGARSNGMPPLSLDLPGRDAVILGPRPQRRTTRSALRSSSTKGPSGTIVCSSLLEGLFWRWSRCRRRSASWNSLHGQMQFGCCLRIVRSYAMLLERAFSLLLHSLSRWLSC
jgi:hypothetical protein